MSLFKKDYERAREETYDIEADTPLMLDVVADTVVGEIELYLDTALAARGEAIVYLLTTARETYQTNAKWRAKIRHEVSGRDTLYTFMRHWLAAWIRRNEPALSVPESFANGLPLRRGALPRGVREGDKETKP